MSAIVGTTNIDGTGSASNLTAENGEVLDLSFKHTNPYGDDQYKLQGLVIITDSWDHYGNGSNSIINSGEWGESGLKELHIDSSSGFGGNQWTYLAIKNFVDVYLHLTYDLGSQYSSIAIYDAKRGDIDISAFDDGGALYIDVYSNSADWSNLFTIQGGASNDSVTLDSENGNGSQWTEFSVNLGGSSDSFRCYLDAAASSEQTRYVDGGTGEDRITATNLNDIDFVSFKYIINGSDEAQTLELDQELLANNASSTYSIVLKDLDIEIVDDYDDVTVSEKSSSGNYRVVITYDDEQYILYTNLEPTELV